MEYDILLTKQPNNGYVARPVLMPEIVVSGEDEHDVLTRVGEAIAGVYTQSRIVRIKVPTSDETTAEIAGDPWLRFSGMWGNENEWSQFEADIDEFRNEIDLYWS